MKRIMVSVLICLFLIFSITPAFAAEEYYEFEYIKWRESTGDGYVLVEVLGDEVTISESGETTDIPKGETVVITIKAQPGSEITSVAYNGAPLSYERPATELNMKVENYSGNNSLKVAYDKATYLCSTSCIGDGKITITSPKTELTQVKVPVGDSFAFTVEADADSEIYSMTINGEEVDLSRYGKNETNKISKFSMELPDIREVTSVVVTFVKQGEGPALKFGDVNADGKVNVVDATAIQKQVAGLLTFNSQQIKIADVDGDEKVSVKDATAVQKFTAGIISSFPAEKK